MDIEAAVTRLIGIGKSLPNAEDREAVGFVLAELQNVERAARWNGDVASTWSNHIRRLRENRAELRAALRMLLPESGDTINYAFEPGSLDRLRDLAKE